jgi:CRISPR system Cascade subunit CasA
MTTEGSSMPHDTVTSAPPPIDLDLADFNLLDAEWIPVRCADGSSKRFGLLEVFRQSEHIVAISDHRPTSVVAVYRILLAILHRSLAVSGTIWTDGDRAQWYRTGLPIAAVETHLEGLRDRFFVFHPECPFMQVAALALFPETAEKFKPWSQISIDSANGNNPVLFDHSVDVVATDRAVREVVLDLLGFLQFTPGGLVKTLRASDKAGPIANTAATLALGDTLQKTLLLNLHPMAAAGSVDEDLPSWERPPPQRASLEAGEKPAVGPNDRYTRISRAVLLRKSSPQYAEPTVRDLRFAVGEALGEDANAPDPMASYRMGSKDLVRITFQEGRSTWRDLGSLLPDPTSGHARPAAVLEWSRNLQDRLDETSNDALPILIAGLCSDQAKLVRWRSESYRIPLGALRSADVAVEIRRQLARCESLHFDLRMAAAQMLAEAMPTPTSRDTAGRARKTLEAGPLTPEFFAVAERSLPALMNAVSSGDLDGAHEQWTRALIQASKAAWGAAEQQLGSSTAAVRARAKTSFRFARLLKGLADPEPIRHQGAMHE